MENVREAIIRAYDALPTCREAGVECAREYEGHKIISPLAFLRAIFGPENVPGPPPSNSCDPTYLAVIGGRAADGCKFLLTNPTQDVFPGSID